jgi:hypothetical protein
VIVNHTHGGWEVIYQRAHGLLAVKLAYHWREEDRSPFWIELLAALTQHDNNQSELRENQLTPQGAPADFMIAKGSPLEQARRVIDDASYQGRYVALLTSMHTSYIYQGKAKDDPAFAAFLKEQAEAQKRWLRALGLKKKKVERDYGIMQWCDRCSLILCEGELPADERRLEVTPLPDGKPSFIWQRADESLGVEPWPFMTDDLEVSVEVSQLDQLEFKTVDAFHRALKDAPTLVKTWRFEKQSKR